MDDFDDADDDPLYRPTNDSYDVVLTGRPTCAVGVDAVRGRRRRHADWRPGRTTRARRSTRRRTSARATTVQVRAATTRAHFTLTGTPADRPAWIALLDGESVRGAGHDGREPLGDCGGARRPGSTRPRPASGRRSIRPTRTRSSRRSPSAAPITAGTNGTATISVSNGAAIAKLAGAATKVRRGRSRSTERPSRTPPRPATTSPRSRAARQQGQHRLDALQGERRPERRDVVHRLRRRPVLRRLPRSRRPPTARRPSRSRTAPSSASLGGDPAQGEVWTLTLDGDAVHVHGRVPRRPRDDRAQARRPAEGADLVHTYDVVVVGRTLTITRDNDATPTGVSFSITPSRRTRRSSARRSRRSSSFTQANWNVAQTVLVSAVDDDVVEGGDALVFPAFEDRVNRIRGPLTVDGGQRTTDEQFLVNPLLLPGETNLPIPTGRITDAAPAERATASITDLERDARQRAVRRAPRLRPAHERLRVHGLVPQRRRERHDPRRRRRSRPTSSRSAAPRPSRVGAIARHDGGGRTRCRPLVEFSGTPDQTTAEPRRRALAGRRPSSRSPASRGSARRGSSRSAARRVYATTVAARATRCRRASRSGSPRRSTSRSATRVEVRIGLLGDSRLIITQRARRSPSAGSIVDSSRRADERPREASAASRSTSAIGERQLDDRSVAVPAGAADGNDWTITLDGARHDPLTETYTFGAATTSRRSRSGLVEADRRRARPTTRRSSPGTQVFFADPWPAPGGITRAAGCDTAAAELRQVRRQAAEPEHARQRGRPGRHAQRLQRRQPGRRHRHPHRATSSPASAWAPASRSRARRSRAASPTATSRR